MNLAKPATLSPRYNSASLVVAPYVADITSLSLQRNCINAERFAFSTMLYGQTPYCAGATAEVCADSSEMDQMNLILKKE